MGRVFDWVLFVVLVVVVLITFHKAGYNAGERDTLDRVCQKQYAPYYEELC